MMRIAALLGLFAAAGCGDFLAEYAADQKSCRAAQTYQEKFGTPDNHGPCWQRTIAVSHMGDISAYVIEMNVPQNGIGTITYQGNTMIQAGMSAGF